MPEITKLIRKIKKRPFCSAVVVAAGSSVRAGCDKLFTDLGGMPVLARTLSILDQCECIDEIVVVTRKDKVEEVARICSDYGFEKVNKVVCGGETRVLSALAGVSETNPRAAVIAIHDGARPLVTDAVIAEAVHAAVLHKAAAPAIPIKDTLKRVDGPEATGTIPREQMAAVQTPQVFHADLIKAALSMAVDKKLELTDDCSAVEAVGARVRMTVGSEENIKLTTPLDFRLAEAILESRQKL